MVKCYGHSSIEGMEEGEIEGGSHGWWRLGFCGAWEGRHKSERKSWRVEGLSPLLLLKSLKSTWPYIYSRDLVQEIDSGLFLT
uniref:Uncharacterized protein n=1 Tax=Arundo donax TaxID=35708 RepID=A0A0A9A2Z4_ARUDO